MPIIHVIAKPGSRKTEVLEIDSNSYIVKVREKAIDGAANIAIARALSRYLRIAPSCIMLKRGSSGRNKLFEVHARTT